MENKDIRELIGGLIAKFELENGYAKASADLQKALPPPEKVSGIGSAISRTGDDKKSYVLRFGYLRQPGQLPQLWALGLVLAPPGPAALNPDAEKVDDTIKAILDSRQQNQANIPLASLETRVIRLSYIDVDSAMNLLKSMGINVIGGTPPPAAAAPPAPAAPGTPPPPDVPPESVALPNTVNSSQLPLVIKMPGPGDRSAGLVGGGEAIAAGAMGTTAILGATTRLAPDTISSPPSQLMVMFHPDNPEQLARVRKLLSEHIDRPARQILVEAMVLEISKDALDELGISWAYQEGMQTLALGTLTAGAGANSIDFLKDSSRAFLTRNFLARVQALVRLGKAEVLSRPSVLTLDNRQATIRVGTDIPIATSKDASSATESRVSFSFQYLPTGIQLNIRPRADEEGREVSMIIDASVSATVPGEDLALRSPATGQVLASAPTIATRRVQTYARIPDNTPLIIGGLISLNAQEATDKVPGLGDLPLIGRLFRSTTVQSNKREVIIVLTPYVLPEGRANFQKALPKDDEAFDSLDNQLFRDAYRLRAGDVFDTGYIRNNRRLVAYRDLVKRVAENDPLLAEKPPLPSIAENRIPGEQTLMNGMLYETLRRNDLGGEIIANRMLMFDDANGASFRARRLDSLIAEYGDGKDYRSFFAMHPDKAIAITFLAQRALPGDVLAEPKPKVAVVDCCRDRTAWKQILWDLNQPDADGRERSTILIKDESDIVKLSRAHYIKRMMLVNGGESRATISNFLVGRQVQIPEVRSTQTHLIDADVARFFLDTELYYISFEQQFERTLDEVDKLLRSDEFKLYIKESGLPALLQTDTGVRRK